MNADDDQVASVTLQAGEVPGVSAESDLSDLLRTARRLRDQGHGDVITYSKNVFIPLTHLCRDVCHYCTYAKSPRSIGRPYMTPDEVLAVARAGKVAGCTEALFTLGDKPELRYRVAREALDSLGCKTTLEYVVRMADLVVKETGLLPHINAGVMAAGEIEMLKTVSVSQGLMLESSSQRLCEKGGPHYGSPDKDPVRRLETIRLAGELKVPFTSGILIGIGETRAERLESLKALRDLHRKYGHIQEIIVQNFRSKPGTIMADAPEATIDELIWTVANARLIFGPAMNIQVPPNLNRGESARLIRAGINDWGGVSPVTPDFVNPEAPWPNLDTLAEQTMASGKILVERLPVYPEFLGSTNDWLNESMYSQVLKHVDSQGYARTDSWSPGQEIDVPALPDTASGRAGANQSTVLNRILRRASDGETLTENEIVSLFESRDAAFNAVCAAANDLRAATNGDVVSFVVNRNINYTNVCYYRCGFCAFSKGKHSEQLRGPSYDLKLEEIVRRTLEAIDRGATEVCLQGGIHPHYTGNTYLEICSAIRRAAPDVHIHAFSPLEIWQGADTLGISVQNFLEMLQEAGLNTLPGTAAEILDDEVRDVICPDKVNTQQWIDVITAAHELELKTTSTIMFGHVEQPRHWARHLLRLRALQVRTGGITEFVPLPFVHMEAPIYLKGHARAGPTYREAILMHAVARLVLHPHITNIQTSWVKMGVEGAKACLRAGCNDLGGTLMNESISRAAGSAHGQEMSPTKMQEMILNLKREPQQRTTLYGSIPLEKSRALFDSRPLRPVVNTMMRRRREKLSAR